MDIVQDPFVNVTLDIMALIAQSIRILYQVDTRSIIKTYLTLTGGITVSLNLVEPTTSCSRQCKLEQPEIAINTFNTTLFPPAVRIDTETLLRIETQQSLLATPPRAHGLSESTASAVATSQFEELSYLLALINAAITETA